MPYPTLALRAVLISICLCLALTLPGGSPQAEAHQATPPGGILVRWRPGTAEARVLADLGLAVVDRIPQLGVVVVAQGTSLAPTLSQSEREDRDSQLLAQLNKRSDVEWAEPNRAWSVGPVVEDFDGALAAQAVNDPMAGQQYSLERMAVGAAWDATRGDGVTVAVVDTGADFSHPDLAGKLVGRGRDFVNNDDDASDDHGHGTHVAGIIAAATNNGQGIAGVGYNTRVLPVKALAANGNGSTAQIAQAITWAADQGVRVINMSLGGPNPSATMEQAVNYAWAKGVVVVCAAGNDGSSSPSYPAAYPNCLSVAATDQADTRARFSNYGSTVDVAAPGVQVLSTVRGGRYESWSGTSMASPNVAGVAALVWAAHPSWSNAQVRAAIEQGADPVNGLRRVNAARAVGGNSSPLPSPTAGGRPTATAQPVPGACVGSFGEQVECLINRARAANGLAPLRIDERLRAASAAHNQYMAEHNCFAHQCPGEADPLTRMREAGYPLRSGGENIGKGYQTPQAMMDGWMNSSGHRAAILNTFWPDLGCAFLAGGAYWTCDFASGADTSPATATPLPRPQPTPVPLPTPTGAPPPPAWLPPGWLMTLTVPPYAPTLALWRTRWNLCQAYQGRGVTCRDVVGQPLVAWIDYDVAPPSAPHYAWWQVYVPYQAFGVTDVVRHK